MIPSDSPKLPTVLKFSPPCVRDVAESMAQEGKLEEPLNDSHIDQLIQRLDSQISVEPMAKDSGRAFLERQYSQARRREDEQAREREQAKIRAARQAASADSVVQGQQLPPPAAALRPGVSTAEEPKSTPPGGGNSG